MTSDITCPECGRTGKPVNPITVISMLKDERAILSDKSYYICTSPDCNTAYYSEAGITIDKSEIKERIWFKEQSPVTICYCQQVTDTNVIDHVAMKKCCRTLEDIQNHTGANTGCECLIKNPAGT